MKPHVVALAAVGGAVGAGARYAVFETWPVEPGRFPTTTLVINVVGAFVLGIVVTRMARAQWARPLLGIGVLSAFTTMSTLAAEVAALARGDHWTTASVYACASIGLGVAAATAGLRLGRA